MANDASTNDAVNEDDATTTETENLLSQEQVNRLLASEKRKWQDHYADYDDLKQAKERLDQLEESQKTELEKLQDQLDKLTKSESNAKTELLRLRVALKKGLNETQAKRLIGDNEEELLADADELLGSFAKTDEEASDEQASPLRRKPQERTQQQVIPANEPSKTVNTTSLGDRIAASMRK